MYVCVGMLHRVLQISSTPVSVSWGNTVRHGLLFIFKLNPRVQQQQQQQNASERVGVTIRMYSFNFPSHS